MEEQVVVRVAREYGIKRQENRVLRQTGEPPTAGLTARGDADPLP
jgi:hypothetical protein